MRAWQQVLISGIAGVAACGEPALAQTYDAFKQFSLKNNPNGPWSYVAAGRLLTAREAKCDALPRLYCWTNGGTSFPSVAADEANKAHTILHYADVVLPPGYLDFDPQGIATVAFQWTAPAAANVRIEGNFLGVATDEGTHNVAVLDNGVALATYTIATYQQTQTSGSRSALLRAIRSRSRATPGMAAVH
jgi:hypothetical protein